VTEDGFESDILGREGYNEGTVKQMGAVENLKTIRIRVGGGTKTPKELELIGEMERTLVKTNDYGNYTSFDLS